VLVKSRDGRQDLNTAVVAGGRKGKDDGQQYALAPLENAILLDSIQKENTK
jgi:hypothetical protein